MSEQEKKWQRILICLTPRSSQSFFVYRIQSKEKNFFLQKKNSLRKRGVEDWTKNEKKAFLTVLLEFANQLLKIAWMLLAYFKSLTVTVPSQVFKRHEFFISLLLSQLAKIRVSVREALKARPSFTLTPPVNQERSKIYN